MGWWNEIFTKKAEDWIFEPLAPEQVPDKLPHAAVPKESAYLSVTVKSARIVNVRQGLAKFYGVVNSFISVPHLSGANAEFNVITTPAFLKNIDAAHIDRVIQLDQRLLGPIPYRGGQLALEIGLFSIKSVDLAAPYLEVLEAMSKQAGVAFINAALPFAEPLKTGINLLVGGGDNSPLEIGLASSAWTPETGYFVVMRAPKGSVPVSDLRVGGTDYRLVGPDNQPVGDYPYMVLKVEASSSRDDWFNIKELHKPYQELKTNIRGGDYEAAKNSFIFFKRSALTCDDLLFDDAKKLVAEVDSTFKDIMEEPTAKGLVPKGARIFPELQEIQLYS